MELLKAVNEKMYTIDRLIKEEIAIEFLSEEEYLEFIAKIKTVGIKFSYDYNMWKIYVESNEPETKSRYNGTCCIDIYESKILGFCDRTWYETISKKTIIKYRDMVILWNC